MASPWPSRQALRHLSRLCRSFENQARASRPSSHQTICTHTQRARLIPYHKSRLAFLPAISKPFSTTPTHSVQPTNTAETDPQNIANPTLPDITNYYTLFPSTLPSGPPGPNPREQSPESSSTPSNSTPSSAEFNIHIPSLRKEFLQLQSQHHPDKYPTGSTAHQKALALSALINNAYKTLSDPMLRAQYLLQIQYDIDVMSEDNAAHPTDQETLVDVMEAQERIEDATGQEEIDAIMDLNRERMAETERLMGEAFENGDVDTAKDECVRLKYWRSLQDALKEWEPGKEVRLIH